MQKTTTGLFGDGAFSFRRWETPFENTPAAISGLTYDAGGGLSITVETLEPSTVYSVVFDWVSAFRLLDENGLEEFWTKTSYLGGRPGQTTFMVRNHMWTRESILSFVDTDGWSFVIASDTTCVEVASGATPSISRAY